nr:helix-turn-helix transcriptional regulator [Streptococcus pseudoporcinus]
MKVLQNRLKQLMLKKHKTVEQVSQETGIKKGSLEMYILGKDIMTEDLDNCFYNFLIQSLEFTVLENNGRAERFFKELTFQPLDDCIVITVSDRYVIEALESYNQIIRYHYPEGGDYTPILSFKGKNIE